MKKLISLICLLICCLNPVEARGENKTEDNEKNSFHFFVNPIAGPEEAYIKIILINKGKNKLEFEAPTSQWYDFTITNEKNEIVYVYSKGKFFLQALQKIILNPGESKIWIENLNDQTEKRLIPGKYKVNAKLKATSVNGDSIQEYHSLIDQAVMIVPPENPIIRNVQLIKKNGSIVVSGQARPTLGVLYYVVEDGHDEWISETKMNLEIKHPNWTDFSFEVIFAQEPEKLPFILYLYEKDKKGNIIHTYPKMLR